MRVYIVIGGLAVISNCSSLDPTTSANPSQQSLSVTNQVLVAVFSDFVEDGIKGDGSGKRYGAYYFDAPKEVVDELAKKFKGRSPRIERDAKNIDRDRETLFKEGYIIDKITGKPVKLFYAELVSMGNETAIYGRT